MGNGEIMEYNDVRHAEAEWNRQSMRPVRQRYGFYRVPDGPVAPPECSMCKSPHVKIKINEILFCDSCFNSTR